MEEGVLNFIFKHIKSLKITDCDVYLNKPTIVGENEKLKDAYVIVAFPNGFNNKGAFSHAEGIITIGAKDRIIGLPNIKNITRIADIIKNAFPIINDEYSFLDFEFSSDDSEGAGWHEYYYSFQLYINKN